MEHPLERCSADLPQCPVEPHAAHCGSNTECSSASVCVASPLSIRCRNRTDSNMFLRQPTLTRSNDPCRGRRSPLKRQTTLTRSSDPCRGRRSLRMRCCHHDLTPPTNRTCFRWKGSHHPSSRVSMAPLCPLQPLLAFAEGIEMPCGLFCRIRNMASGSSGLAAFCN